MDKQKLIVISLETAKNYAESGGAHSIDEALIAAKSVYETLKKVEKDSISGSLENYFDS